MSAIDPVEIYRTADWPSEAWQQACKRVADDLPPITTAQLDAKVRVTLNLAQFVAALRRIDKAMARINARSHRRREVVRRRRSAMHTAYRQRQMARRRRGRR